LDFAALAYLSGRAESEMAETFVPQLAEQHLRGTDKDDTAKPYRQVKTRAAHADPSRGNRPHRTPGPT
jgi:hypothetical protein